MNQEGDRKALESPWAAPQHRNRATLVLSFPLVFSFLPSSPGAPWTGPQLFLALTSTPASASPPLPKPDQNLLVPQPCSRFLLAPGA